MTIPERYRTPLIAVLAALSLLIGVMIGDLTGDDQTAPPTTVEPTTTSSTAAPTTTLPSTTTTIADGPVDPPTDPPPVPPGILVDDADIPAPNDADARDGVQIVSSGFTPRSTPSDPTGAQFRLTCHTSHYLYDDPIIYPDGPGRSHLHTFFGNTSVHAGTTDMAEGAASTCAGGAANLSSYWVPTMIDTDNATVVPGWDTMSFEAYYKSGYEGVAAQDIVDYPAGLRMIAGDPARTSPHGQIWQSPVWYSCRNGSAEDSQVITDCAPGDIMVMHVEFPQCWDGVNLDSPDHKSHMAYGAGWPDQGCPASHPVPLTQITYNVYYPVGLEGTSSWRLSSDVYEGPAGYSGHGDWWNGWTVFDQVIDNCFAPYPGLDCGQNNFGDGTALAWAWR